jgi:hypothetical protein
LPSISRSTERSIGNNINLDAKPDIIQQQEKRAFIHYTTADCDLGLYALAALGGAITPWTAILVETDLTTNASKSSYGNTMGW